jgi:hypothetical protein
LKRAETSQKIGNKLRGNALWAGLSAESMKKGAESIAPFDNQLVIIKVTRIGLPAAIHFALSLPKADRPAIAGRGFFVFPLSRASSHRSKTKKAGQTSSGRPSDPDWIQTNDPKLRRFVLYSAELPGQYFHSRQK